MSLHKIRPRLKHQSKINFFLKKEEQLKKGSFFKNKTRVFSPDVRYLSAKRINKLERNFADRLDTRRKVKLFFGFHRTSLLKKVLRGEYKKNARHRYTLNELEFCSVLERRLDVLLYRLGFVPTLFAAKQLISHKKVRVNAHANASFSRLLKKGDVISFDFSTQLEIQKNLLKYLEQTDFNFSNSNQIEINFKTLRVAILTNKINLLSQIPQYYFSLR